MNIKKVDPLKADFRKFMFVVWKHLNLPDPTPVQYDIAQFLQHGPKRAVIEAFRGVGKSWVTAAFVCWLLYCDPQLKILVVSASKERADAFATFVKRLIHDMPLLQHLAAGDKQRDSMLSFDVGPASPDQSPSVKSAGITGQITGSRADIIIADDIEVPKNSFTQAMRDKLAELVKEFDAILKPLPTSRIIYLGTPQTEMSLYNQLPERGYTVRVWPALYPPLEDIQKYSGRLAPLVTRAIEKDVGVIGKPTDPQRFSAEDLQERRVSYGRGGFALQFQLDTSLSDGDKYPLKIGDLIIMNLNPIMAHVKIAWAASPELTCNDLPVVGLSGDRYYRPMWHDQQMSEYTGTVMAIDPSGRGSDETGYAIVKMLAGNLFLMAAGGLKGGYSPENLEKLARLAKRHGVNHVIVEPNFGDGMFTQLLKPVMGAIHPCLVEDGPRSVNQKELRIIDVLEPVLSSHKLIVDMKVIQEDYDSASEPAYSLFYQLTRITRDRGALGHDDRLDALAMAVRYWVDRMAQDNNKAAESIKEDALANELANFMDNALGRQKAPKVWQAHNMGHRD